MQDMHNPCGFHPNTTLNKEHGASSYEFTANKRSLSFFNPSLLGMEHDRMYKQNIHNALRYFLLQTFSLNFIPDKKTHPPIKSRCPTLQSKNLPNTSALYCGRKIVLSILCLIKGLDVKKITVPAGYTLCSGL